MILGDKFYGIIPYWFDNRTLESYQFQRNIFKAAELYFLSFSKTKQKLARSKGQR